MNCEQTQQLLLEAISSDDLDGLSPALREHVQGCADCTALVQDTTWIRDTLRHRELTVPTEQLRERFYAGLLHADHDQAQSMNRETVRPVRIVQLGRLAAAVALIFAVGYLSATLLNSRPGELEPQSFAVSGGTMSDRIAAIYAHVDAAEPDRQVVEVLMYALRSDPNANVRVAAIEALATAIDDSQVATTIQETVLLDQSPNVQAVALRTLVNTRPALARATIAQYLLRPDIEPLLRNRAEAFLQSNTSSET